jgi:hypothetical protein
VRVSEVEQVFCSQGGGAIAFADLTQPSPAFRHRFTSRG